MKILALCVLSVLLGAALALLWLRPAPPPLPPETVVIERVQHVARLEALEVRLYRKISFAPDPLPSETLWGDVVAWARHTLRPPQGKAIVFARAHLRYDLRQLRPAQLRLKGPEADLQLPPLQVEIELLPEETEVIGSNLDTAETNQLLALAKSAFAREVEQDPLLRQRAEASAVTTLRALLFEMGFRNPRVMAAPAG